MFKFLFYLFLFYVVFRFIFGVLFKGVIKTRIVNINNHHHYHQQKKEAKVQVDPRTVKPAAHDDKGLGEYVDYEEVK
jgi:hypothetical protein